MANTQDKIISPFTDVPYMELSDPSEEQEGMYRGVKELQIGQGSNVLRADQQGLWLGAARFEDAPFRVDMEGNITATSLDLSNFLEIGEALGDIGAGNITSTYIANGAIVTGKLAAQAVTAAKIDVTDLFAQTITATGSITGLTLTGGIVRTASSGSRAQLNGATNSLQVYNGSTMRMQLAGEVLLFYNSSGTTTGSLYAGATGMLISADSGNLVLSTASSSKDVAIAISSSVVALFTNTVIGFDRDLDMGGNDITSIGSLGLSGGLTLGGNLNMGGYDIVSLDDITCDDINADTLNASLLQLSGGGYIDNARAFYFETGRSTNPSVSGEIRYYDSGTKGFRGYVNGFRGQFDLTAT